MVHYNEIYQTLLHVGKKIFGFFQSISAITGQCQIKSGNAEPVGVVTNVENNMLIVLLYCTILNLFV